jgi:hypothetical protein
MEALVSEFKKKEETSTNRSQVWSQEKEFKEMDGNEDKQ